MGSSLTNEYLDHFQAAVLKGLKLLCFRLNQMQCRISAALFAFWMHWRILGFAVIMHFLKKVKTDFFPALGGEPGTKKVACRN